MCQFYILADLIFVAQGHTHTYNVKSVVGVTADVPSCIFGAAVVQAIIIRTGILEGERPLFIVDLMSFLRQLHAVLEPLACRPEKQQDEEEREEEKSF